MKQAVIYTRFSPRPNAGDCDSCEFQEQKAREYCEDHGWDILAVHRDKAASGKGMSKKQRPGLNKALGQVLQFRGILVCYNMARLSRSIKDICNIADMLAQKHAHLVLITEQVDTKNAMGRFFFHIMASVSQFQREITAEHTRDVLLTKQKNGYLVSKAPPFGYKLAPESDWDWDETRQKWKKKIRLDHSEQETIRIARMLKRQRMTVTAIAKELTRLGRKPRGSKWHANTVKRILDKPDAVLP